MTNSQNITPFRHIAVFIEDSEASRRALAYARAVRTLAPGRLSVVHVAQWPLGELGGWGAYEREWLERQVALDADEEAVLLTGDPCEWARENQVDLMVAAPYRGGLERALLGSFCAYLVRHAPCPVLLPRPVAGEADGAVRLGEASLSH